MPARFWIICGGLLGALAVGAGAFGAHYLKRQHDQGLFDARQLENFETAVRYQMIHAVALVLTGLVARSSASRLPCVSGTAFLLGSLLFCGCLALHAFTQARWLAAPIPFGGGAFIVGWLALAFGGTKAEG